jgi:hypothetical protein
VRQDHELSLAERVAKLPPAERAAIAAELTQAGCAALEFDWSFWGRPEQIAPPGNCDNWLILAGRGFGKTRTGAEWVRANMCGDTPLTGGRWGHVALVAETAADARDVMAWAGGRDEARYAQVVGYGTAFGGGTVAELRNDELMYIRPNAATATPFGFGPLEMAFDTINNILQVAESTGNVAGNQRSSILLDLGEGYTQGDIETFRSYWINEIEGQGKVPITAISSGGRSDDKSKRGVEVHRLYPEGDNGMFLEYQRFLIRTLAASFDLSPMNFGVDADVNRNQGEVNEDRDWNQAIKPCAAQISSHLTRDVLHQKLGFSQLRFKFVGLDREDELANAQISKIRYEANAITPNEYRNRLGEAPAENEWGDLTLTSKTSTGFNVVLQPTLSTTSIAAGTFNVLVVG